MKKLIATLALAGSLGACSSLGGVNGNISDVVAQIESGVNFACGYAVQAETVIAILSAGSLTSVSGIINMICAAVKPSTVAGGALRASHVPVVHVGGRTIVVRGHF